MKTKKINIPLDQQVVDLETAKELTKKLASVGVEMESAFYYQRRRNRILNDEIKYSDKSVYTKWQKWWLLEAKRCDSGNAYKQVESIPALTLPELLALLPYSIPNKWGSDSGCEWGRNNNCSYYGRCSNSQLTIEKMDKYSYDIGYTCQEHAYVSIISIVYEDENQNPATALAKLAIWCIDNGYIGDEK